MKEKIKPMAIGAGIGAAGLAGVAFLMKKPTKGMLMFAGVGLVLGAVAGYLMAKPEEKSGAAGVLTGRKCVEYDTNGRCTSWKNPTAIKE